MKRLLILSLCAIPLQAAVNIPAPNWIGSGVPTSTTAALPPASPAGQVRYVSDCLTPQGTGACAFSDGTNWRILGGIIATATAETYLTSLLKSGRIQGDGQYDAGYIDHWAGAGQSAATAVGSPFIRTLTATQTGASITVSATGVTGSGGILFLTSGTALNGIAGLRSAGFDTVNQGYDIIYEKVFNLPTLSTATDEYWILYGMTDNGTAGSTADANIIAFLYDRANTWATTGGTATNWKLMTKKTGVGTTITESSVAVATGLHSFRVYRNAAGTTAHFWIDGTQVGGNVTANMPASGTTFRMGFDVQNTAHAGAANNIGIVKDGYALRRTTALYQ